MGLELLRRIMYITWLREVHHTSSSNYCGVPLTPLGLPALLGTLAGASWKVSICTHSWLIHTKRVIPTFLICCPIRHSCCVSACNHYKALKTGTTGQWEAEKEMTGFSKVYTNSTYCSYKDMHSCLPSYVWQRNGKFFTRFNAHRKQERITPIQCILYLIHFGLCWAVDSHCS